MQNEYIERRHSGYYLVGTRISLDSVVYCFNEGRSPEAIQEDFPSLRLAQIHGAIAFYLDHQTEIDNYLATAQQDIPSGPPLSEENPGLWRRLQQAKSDLEGSPATIRERN